MKRDRSGDTDPLQNTEAVPDEIQDALATLRADAAARAPYSDLAEAVRQAEAELRALKPEVECRLAELDTLNWDGEFANRRIPSGLRDATERAVREARRFVSEIEVRGEPPGGIAQCRRVLREIGELDLQALAYNPPAGAAHAGRCELRGVSRAGHEAPRNHRSQFPVARPAQA